MSMLAVQTAGRGRTAVVGTSLKPSSCPRRTLTCVRGPRDTSASCLSQPHSLGWCLMTCLRRPSSLLKQQGHLQPGLQHDEASPDDNGHQARPACLAALLLHSGAGWRPKGAGGRRPRLSGGAPQPWRMRRWSARASCDGCLPACVCLESTKVKAQATACSRPSPARCKGSLSGLLRHFPRMPVSDIELHLAEPCSKLMSLAASIR